MLIPVTSILVQCLQARITLTLSLASFMVHDPEKAKNVEILEMLKNLTLFLVVLFIPVPPTSGLEPLAFKCY